MKTVTACVAALLGTCAGAAAATPRIDFSTPPHDAGPPDSDPSCWRSRD